MVAILSPLLLFTSSFVYSVHFCSCKLWRRSASTSTFLLFLFIVYWSACIICSVSVSYNKMCDKANKMCDKAKKATCPSVRDRWINYLSMRAIYKKRWYCINPRQDIPNYSHGLYVNNILRKGNALMRGTQSKRNKTYGLCTCPCMKSRFRCLSCEGKSQIFHPFCSQNPQTHFHV